ncbi:uncharacterized protein LOC103317390 [Nasonia vitripennis]|uniref:Uncharacterized protein n=1 Tax=Nasonia vitripennis TaxID=7425 RepID=A0A7M7PWL4_NASVI|nr:uncharacterized protein LOC103317390 [Nasonia vitripennis]
MNPDKVEIDIVDPDTGIQYFLKVSPNVANQVKNDDNMRHQLLQHMKKMSDGEIVKMSTAMKSPSNLLGPSNKEHLQETGLPLKTMSVPNNFQSNADSPDSDTDNELEPYIDSAKKLNELSSMARSSYSPIHNAENYSFGREENNDEQGTKCDDLRKRKYNKQTSSTNKVRKNNYNDVTEFDV